MSFEVELLRETGMKFGDLNIVQNGELPQPSHGEIEFDSNCNMAAPSDMSIFTTQFAK